MASYMAYRPLTPQYTPCSRDRSEYIAESGMYTSTAGSILLSQWCIIWTAGLSTVNVYSWMPLIYAIMGITLYVPI